MSLLFLLLACDGPEPDPLDTGPDTATPDADDTDSGDPDPDTEDTTGTGRETGETGDSGGDTGSSAWEPLAPYTFTSTWANSACPSFAPYDVPGQNWRFRSIPGNPIAYALETRGETTLDSKPAWLVVLDGTGYDFGAYQNWFIVCDSDGVKLAAIYTHQSGGGGPSSSSATYYDPPLLFFPATLAEGSFSATTWEYRASDGNDADGLPYTVTEGAHTQSGTVGAPTTYTTERAGSFEVWPVSATTLPFRDAEVFVAEGYGVVVWGESFELDSYTVE